MSYLELANLKKTYPDGTEAVKGIDLNVEEGEFIVLLGPSGCGKTTTLRMVAGLEIPTGGTIKLNGKDVTNLRPSQRDVGFVFQFYALYPHMSVRENIAFPLRSVGMSKQEINSQVESFAERLGITPLLPLHPGRLSGGDQQRISLARAMVRRPQIYLMDEPLGTLDSDRRLELRELIRVQQQELNVTTIYVTHDQEEAMTLADRIVVMKEGLISQADTPDHVYGDPQSRFVADFVGSPGMNLLSGEVRENSFVVGDTSLALGRNVRAGKATLGVRSEHLREGGDGIAAEVVMDEYLGSHRSVHLETGLGRLIMRSDGTTTREVGQKIQLSFDLQRTVLFDPETGKRI